MSHLELTLSSTTRAQISVILSCTAEAIFLDIAVARTRRETKKRHPRSTYGKRAGHHGKNSKPLQNRLSQGLYCLTIQPLGCLLQPTRSRLVLPLQYTRRSKMNMTGHSQGQLIGHSQDQLFF